MSDWKTLSSETVYETPWFSVIKDQVAIHNGKELTYSYLQMPHPGVTVVAVNVQGEILLQKNYRYPLKTELWEVPSGHADDDEPLVAAKRELLEEAGLESDDWQSLGEAYLACGIASIQHYLFVARDVRSTTDERDEDEAITDQHFVSRDKVSAMLANSDIMDSDSVIALYRYLALEQQ